ncbi:MAG: helix-turn-helix domain-containing protein [Thomasclavelia sp.]|uniref:helix-turn-helix domain-containing protein n=1 Tax=Thomasclavelia sp. TaxID=3025757 RepID=UPI0039A064FD
MIIIKLAQIRYLHNISLRELERLCGIGKTTLNNIENNKISPTLFELEQIAIALKIKIEDLYESDYK